MMLSLKMLSGFSVRDRSGVALPVRLRKTRALLAYLAINADAPQPRERLMALLWGDRDEQQARQSLNDALVSIRRLANGESIRLIDSDAEQVTMHGAALETDVARFRALLDGDPAGAAALYDGPFLDGLVVSEPGFEAWLAGMRSALETEANDALRRGAEAVAEKGDTAKAIEMVRRLLALDPLREDGHRLLMTLLHESGDRVGALRQYQVCREILQEELQVEPDAQTKALFEKIGQDAPRAREAQLRLQGQSAANIELPINRASRRLWSIAVVVAGIILVIGASVLVWWDQRTEPAFPKALLQPPPDKPSIAVLPFTNMSGDPAQEYFSDGITEDLITDLSKVSGLFVIARNSSFSYKGRSVDLRKVARELGVRYVLDGSVRRSGDHIRINAQFVDTKTGGHIWAERFDHKLEDVFALQDAVTRKIVSALKVKFKPAEAQSRNLKPKIHPEAYDLFLRGLERLRRYTPETTAEARQFFQQAAMLDPRFARAIAAIGFTHQMDVFLRAKVDREKALGLAERYAMAALEIDDSIPAVHVALSGVYQRLRRYDQAINAASRAINADTNFADAHMTYGIGLIRAGRPEEGLESIQTALRLDPLHPFFYVTNLGVTYFILGRYDKAAEILEDSLKKNPDFIVCRLWLAATYTYLGRNEDAEWQAAEILALRPDFSLREERERQYLKRESDMYRYIEGLRRAGLPE